MTLPSNETLSISVYYKTIAIYAVPYVLRNKTSNPDITAGRVIKFEVELTISRTKCWEEENIWT
jgi:hypothetical protein